MFGTKTTLTCSLDETFDFKSLNSVTVNSCILKSSSVDIAS